ncbi:hypothetical protein AAHE18_20G196900 [Arachis hypogaea]|nr:uncharacterized protein DS421_20g704740 [Arachis hypogaea]
MLLLKLPDELAAKGRERAATSDLDSRARVRATEPESLNVLQSQNDAHGLTQSNHHHQSESITPAANLTESRRVGDSPNWGFGRTKFTFQRGREIKSEIET